jgi:hypothetical protein
VFLTHVHDDHAGGLRLLPNATVVVATDDWERGVLYGPSFDAARDRLELIGHDSGRPPCLRPQPGLLRRRQHPVAGQPGPFARPRGRPVADRPAAIPVHRRHHLHPAASGRRPGAAADHRRRGNRTAARGHPGDAAAAHRAWGLIVETGCSGMRPSRRRWAGRVRGWCRIGDPARRCCAASASQHGTAGPGPHLRGSPTLSGRSQHTEGAGRG